VSCVEREEKKQILNANVLYRNGIRESDGTFARYIAVKGDLQIRTPDNITDEEAATLGIAITTIVSLYRVSVLMKSALAYDFDVI
jgi:NADPH:quinone reductase-like Zn-dependent oxidoreductase